MRPLSSIASDIVDDWEEVAPSALPYLNAMKYLYSIGDRYGCEDGRSIVLYFLSNSTTWQGSKAKNVKAELREGLKKSVSVVRAKPIQVSPPNTWEEPEYGDEEPEYHEEEQEEEE